MHSVRGTMKPPSTDGDGKRKCIKHAQKISIYKFCLIAKKIYGKKDIMHIK